MSRLKSSKTGDPTGAVDEATFRKAFETIDSVIITSSKDLRDLIAKAQDLMARPAEDWEKRCSGCKLLRSIATTEGVDLDEFASLLKPLEQWIDSCCKDLRSQVVREACICVSYLSEVLKTKFSKCAEAVLQQLINLVQNSAKIMATSGVVTLRFLLRNISSNRIMQIIYLNFSSKSAITRRHLCEMVDIMVKEWPSGQIEKGSAQFSDMLKKGISDADQEARSFSRAACVSYMERFPSLGSSLLKTLEPSRKREIERMLSNSNAGSTTNSQTSLNSVGLGSTSGIMKRPKPILGTSSMAARKQSVAVTSTRANINSMLSNSSRTGRKNGRMVSQSQPASRDVSPTPSTGFSYATQNNNNNVASISRSNSKVVPPERRTSNIQRSLYSSIRTTARANDGTVSYNASREPSPTRSISSIMNTYAKNRRSSVRGRGSIGDGDFMDAGSFQKRGAMDNDDASETSSICSDLSTRSKPGYRKMPQIKFTDKIDEIFSQLNASQWSDKKSGLANLQNYLQQGQSLNNSEIRQTGQLLIKMFNDNQCKQVVLQLMETVQQLIKIYSESMLDLLYQLFIKLLNKQGQELISSHQKAIAETLYVVRSNFPLAAQFAAACRFMNDSTQTPNFKVKTHFLDYFKELIVLAQPDDIINTPGIDLAVGKIIMWSQEPKSNDVRRLAARVIIKLNDLNPKAFHDIIEKQSRNYQDQANKVLKTYQKNFSASPADRKSDNSGTANSSLIKSPPSLNSYQKRLSIPTASIHRNGSISSHQGKSQTPQNMEEPVRRISDVSSNYSPSFRGLNQMNEISNQFDRMNLGSRELQSAITPVPDTAQMANPFSDAFGNDNHVASTMERDMEEVSHNLEAGENIYPINTGNTGPIKKKPIIGYQTLKKIREIDSDDFLSDVLEFLSDHNEKNEHRDNCLFYLADKISKKKVHSWDEHFKPMLLILLETLGDQSTQTRIYALRALRELIYNEMPRFQEFIHLTLMKLLESCLEEDKRASQLAEQCLIQMMKQLHPPELLDMLVPLLSDTQNTSFLEPVMRFINLIVCRITRKDLEDYMPTLNTPLSHLLFNEVSSIRKRTVDCYVNIHAIIKDDLWPYITELPDSKIRLIKVFIEKRNAITNSPAH